jgi:hypothetical protein
MANKNNTYISGDWNLYCDVCAKKIKASESHKRWDGFIVCKDDMEMRQPQDFVRARQDKISVPFSRPRETFVFVDVPYICTVDGSTAIAGLAVTGCSTVGRGYVRN